MEEEKTYHLVLPRVPSTKLPAYLNKIIFRRAMEDLFFPYEDYSRSYIKSESQKKEEHGDKEVEKIVQMN